MKKSVLMSLMSCFVFLISVRAVAEKVFECRQLELNVYDGKGWFVPETIYSGRLTVSNDTVGFTTPRALYLAPKSGRTDQFFSDTTSAMGNNPEVRNFVYYDGLYISKISDSSSSSGLLIKNGKVNYSNGDKIHLFYIVNGNSLVKSRSFSMHFLCE
ncbi:MAG: hypothetical protein K1X29_09400 [Bdellovibrionales bacterium]|nr:hypothetical protein [Bdellovibrionales bacterium]